MLFNIVSPFKVTASWAIELDMYNEWMNEEDYEVDDNGKKKVHKVKVLPYINFAVQIFK